MSAEDNKAIVGRWFTRVLGQRFQPRCRGTLGSSSLFTGASTRTISVSPDPGPAAEGARRLTTRRPSRMPTVMASPPSGRIMHRPLAGLDVTAQPPS